MSISGFMGALGDAFGGYAQAQQADERKRQMADELKFKYANLDEGIADRQARATEADATRRYMSQENNTSRVEARKLSTEERFSAAKLAAWTAGENRKIADAYNQGRLTADAARLAQQAVENEANRKSREKITGMQANAMSGRSGNSLNVARLNGQLNLTKADAANAQRELDKHTQMNGDLGDAPPSPLMESHLWGKDTPVASGDPKMGPYLKKTMTPFTTQQELKKRVRDTQQRMRSLQDQLIQSTQSNGILPSGFSNLPEEPDTSAPASSVDMSGYPPAFLDAIKKGYQP
jgi:hypothetical protein